MLSNEPGEATYGDFALIRQSGVRSFPSLMLGKANKLTLPANGYQSFERLNAVLELQANPIQLVQGGNLPTV